jgi:hypothetical protein
VEDEMDEQETIQVWIDETDPDRPYIVSRGINHVDAPETIAIYDHYADAIARARRIAAKTGLAIVDEG